MTKGSRVADRVYGIAGAAALLAGVAAAPAGAAGFYLQEQSSRGAERAFAGEVADTGAGSLWWNPAASSDVARGEGYIGLSAILPHGDVRNGGTLILRPGQAPAAVGGNPVTRGPIRDGYLPSGALALRLGPTLSAGLALTSPYSFTTDYDAGSWARYTAERTRLRTYDIQPSLAWAPVPALSVGAALNVERATATLSNALPNLSPLLPDGQQVLRGSGWDVGFTVGGRFATGPLTLGLSYKSSVHHELAGSVATAGLLGPLAGQNGTVATEATFRTPWQVDLGARLKLTPALTLEGQVNRFGWNRFDAIRLAAPFNVAIPENYRDTWSYAGGLDYAVDDRWTLRGGIQRDLTPTRDGFRDARVPDGDRWDFALGASRRFARVTIDAAANYLAIARSPIDRTTAAYAGTAAQTPILVDGEIDHARVFAATLGAHYLF